LRGEILRRPRDPEALAADISAMRERMRRELDRSDALYFDIKQGEGGLVDLEFLLQQAVLRHAATHPPLREPRHSVALLQALAGAGVLDATSAIRLRNAHAVLAEASLGCTLDRRPRRVPRGLAQVEDAAAAIAAAWAALPSGN